MKTAVSEFRQRCLVFSREWGKGIESCEELFVLRSWLGALSRNTRVDIVTLESPRAPHPDGLFDLYAIGPATSDGHWPVSLDMDSLLSNKATCALMRSDDLEAQRLWERLEPNGTLLAWSTGAPLEIGANATLTVTPGQRDSIMRRHRDWDLDSSYPALSSNNVVATGLYIPINALAAKQRHNGLGFTDYLLVLTDRTGVIRWDEPPSIASWIAARFPSEHLVVVEAGEASVWHERSLRGRIGVDTRADLWRLIAHARATIDLGPDPHVARECVESMRFGVPVVVPRSTVAAEHVTGGGGMTYDSIAGLFECIEALLDPNFRAELADQAREIADKQFGSPARFVEAVRSILERVTVGPNVTRDETDLDPNSRGRGKEG